MNNLRNIRLEKKISQLNLGIKIGVDQVSISGYETCKSFPNVQTLLKICDLFQVSSDFILDKTDIRTPVDQLVINNFSKEELELLAIFKKIPYTKRERALGILIGLSE